MTIQWWRSWHGAPMDAKWLVISNRSGVKPGIVSAVAWELCDYASQNEERGSIKGFDAEVYAAFSGFSEDEINSVLKAMREKNFIDKNDCLTNWIKRQPAREDDSRERVTKFRELKRNVTQCNAPDKDTDKDIETDKDNNLPAKKTAGKRPATNQYLFEIAKALSEVTGLDFEKNRGRLFRVAKSFKEGEQTQIINEYGVGKAWYHSDWRGQKSQKPTPEQVVETWNNLSIPIPNSPYQKRSNIETNIDVVNKFIGGSNGPT